VINVKTPKKIGVDAREIQNGVITGIGRSLANFIKYFNEHESVHSLVLFAENSIPITLSENIQEVVIKHTQTFIWDQILLPLAIKRNNVSLFYSPYYKVPFLTRIPVINQVLDLMYLIFAPYLSALSVWSKIYYFLFGRAFCWKALRVITDSEHAKKDIIRIWRVKPQKVKIISLGIAERYNPVSDESVLRRIRLKLNLPDKFILYLGNFKPHKNVQALVKAFRIIAEKIIDYDLVLAGPLDAYGMRIKQMVKEYGLQDRTVFTGTIREEDHPEVLLSAATVFVFPTLYEGFGLPPLEAMACGTPVVASNLTAVPEVVGDAAILVNPDDETQLSNAMIKLLKSPEKREKYIKKGFQRVALFGENQTAGNIYQHLLQMCEGT
jgi:glycosyltransferase involved in cell wall biosynthesis